MDLLFKGSGELYFCQPRMFWRGQLQPHTSQNAAVKVKSYEHSLYVDKYNYGCTKIKL